MRLLLGRKPLDHLALTANRACIQESYRTIAKKVLNGLRTPQPPAPTSWLYINNWVQYRGSR